MWMIRACCTRRVSIYGSHDNSFYDPEAYLQRKGVSFAPCTTDSVAQGICAPGPRSRIRSESLEAKFGGEGGFAQKRIRVLQALS